MGLWKLALGLGALAGVAVAAIKTVEKLEKTHDGSWTPVCGDFDISFPEPAERPTVYGSGPIIFPSNAGAAGKGAPDDAVQPVEFITLAGSDAGKNDSGAD